MDPASYPDSPMESDDMIFPCKGCGEILEEGKAFELAGNRWHIDCFRCNTCGTLLDSDANLLLLGDGSLICNKCTYSCSSCGEKIEDLAILTGDQAFCATCFKCRNCKRKIENLRYARTSQGIFCMDCHESLMARRRKKTARNAVQQKKPPQPSSHLDKSLPSLPPSAMPKETIPSPEPDLPSSDYVETPPPEVPRHRHLDPPTAPLDNDVAATDASSQAADNLILPSSTYRSNRHSMAPRAPVEAGGDEFLIPVAFDPTPPERPSPQPPPRVEEHLPRDYFNSRESSQKASTERKPAHQEHESASDNPSPHIAYQDKSRQPPDVDPQRRRQDGYGTAAGSVTSPPVASNSTRQQAIPAPPQRSNSEDKFRLQDVPKNKKSDELRMDPRADSGRGSSEESPRPLVPPSRDPSRTAAATTPRFAPENHSSSSPRPSQESRRPELGSSESSRSAVPHVSTLQHPPKRGDSLKNVLAQETTSPQINAVDSGSEYSNSIKSPIAGELSSAKTNGVGARPDSRQGNQHNTKWAAEASLSEMTLPKDHYRAPPLSADNRHHRTHNGSISSQRSESRMADPSTSPSIPRQSTGVEFSMEEDMARILGDEELRNHESFLKRVSNSVRHGRSFSDKGSRLSRDRWPKSPTNGSAFAQDISSPSTSSPDQREDVTWLKNELRRERQRAIEKDQRIQELESTLNGTVNIKQVNSELREKRSTMVVLDTQKEIVVRELEILSEHIASEKKSGRPLDLGKLSNTVLRDFAEAIQRLKDSFSPQIEDLMQKKSDLVEELANLSRMKDKSFQEFEQLSSKNAQLAELNNQLVHQIQELYKANSNAPPAPNGLGIYSHTKDKSSVGEGRERRMSAHDLPPSTSTMTLQPEEAEPVTVLAGPQVVSVRKVQPRKFNWKKGGQNVAKGVTKGLKGAFSSSEPKYPLQPNVNQFTETGSYGTIISPADTAGNLPRSQTQDVSRQGFGFFGNQKSKQPHWKLPSNESSPALSNLAPAANPGALFGTDLEQRLEFEKCVVPGIVTRCIEEVELRGMDVEGIYRKSGGSSQVQMIREGFEKSPHDYDISDPDLDIHAVTSALKQYFRKLPTPLVTYEVYDMILDAEKVTPVQARIEVMQEALRELPRVHRDVVEFLMFHLRRVVDREKENLMTSMNIAVVFAPTIMRPESLSREMTDVSRKNEALQFLVDNCEDVFMGLQE